MHFEVDKRWEDKRFSTRLSDGQEFHAYPYVEVCSGFGLYLLTIKFAYPGSGFYQRRFFVGSVEDVLKTIDQPGIVATRIDYLINDYEKGSSLIHEVRKILYAEINNDGEAYVICCEDGLRYVGDSLLAPEECIE
jgi:hypothetical protein